ncbi:hypothetical protein IFR04_000749 [Cadophora malorum]|uniref:C2H2-type domain-containing protein n=1 Tax=Cadophora malorum TaxID=108018 RepID=A0A8H7WJP9_9HELO|nr:hypothetical protein IFR04_000749 [Cadophora malorum]
MATATETWAPEAEVVLPRKCNYCDRRFRKVEHLKRHERSHTGEKPFKCTQCSKRFSRSDNGLSDSHGAARTSPSSIHSPAAECRRISGRISREESKQNSEIQLGQGMWLGNESEGQSISETRSRRPIQAQTDSATSIDCLGFLANNAPFALPNEASFLDTEMLPVGAGMSTRQVNGDEMHGFDNFNAGAEDMILTEDFQTWFSQLNSSGLSQTHVDHSGFLVSTPGFPIERASKRLRSISLGSAGTSNYVIPDDRFDQVQKFWFHNSGNHKRVMHSLWKELCLFSSDNILAGQEHQDDSNIPQGLPSPQSQNARSPSTCQKSPEDIPQSPPTDVNSGLLSEPKFPPVEILDMALDLYFRHFHPLLPFIHVPTFDPKVFDEPTLFTMCLIGLTLINTHGAKTFVQRAFDVVMDIVETQMRNHTRDSCLSSLSSQRLYVQLLTQAQEQGLFAAETGQKLDENLLGSFDDTEWRWKAWSRVESAKRQVKF